MRSSKLIYLVIALIVLALVPVWSFGSYHGAARASSASASNFTFGQLDWYDENGILQIEDSSWGVMECEVIGDPTQTHYLNVTANAGSGDAWIVQNLPIFPDTIGNGSPRQGVDFDITLLGLSSGTDLPELDFVFSVDSGIRTTAPSGPMATVLVADVQRRSFGSGLASPPLPADVGQPAGVKISQDVTEVIQHRNVPGVQAGTKECLPSAFARSIAWLDTTYKLGLNKTAQQIYNELLAAMGEHGKKSYVDRVAIKNNYLKGINAKAVTKILDLANAIGKVDGVTEETDKDLIEWLKRELPTEDVELHYDKHIVTVTGMYKSGGKTYIKYRDDEHQGDEHQGDDTKGDTAEKHAEIKKDADGKYVFRKKTSHEFFQIQAAVSESVPEVDSFPNSKAKVTINTPFGSDTVMLTGPTTVEVVLGSLAGTDGDGREQVQTEIVQMELIGTGDLLGPVTVRLRDPAKHPFQRSLGEIEETANNTPGVLDIPPFAATGTADSFFDVFFEIKAPAAPPGLQLLHNEIPKHMQTIITHKPPAEGETYESPEVIPLLDESENFTGVEIAAVFHTPIPITIGGVIEPVDKVELVGALVAPYLGPAFVLLLTAGALVLLFKRRKTS